MSKIRLHGSSSGYTEIAPVAASGNNTLTLPNDGTIISKDANGAVGVTSVVTTTATITTAKVGAAVTISESGIEASGIGITVANINGGAIGGRRNIIMNGAMQIAQRGASSTSSSIATVDRFGISVSGTDESPTQAQVDVASGTSPYAEGFRKAYKITNGNQTSGAGSSDRIIVFQNLEAQDIANSGWNYVSSSSNITLSFWAKSSVAQTFYVALTTDDGTSQRYGAAMTFASTDTWTKFSYKIPGNSNLTFDNNTDRGLQVFWTLFRGTDTTDNSFTLNQWAAYNSSIRYPDITSTWYTTNDATFELTGVQLEVGSQATAFEHRTFGEELSLCQRYYYEHANGSVDGSSGETTITENGCFYNSSSLFVSVQSPTTMRTQPSLVISTGSAYYIHFSNGSSNGTFSGTGVAMTGGHSRNCLAFRTNEANGTNGHAAVWRTSNASAKIAFSAEL